MSDLFKYAYSLLQVPADQHGFVITMAAIALAAYAISIVKGR